MEKDWKGREGHNTKREQETRDKEMGEATLEEAQREQLERMVKKSKQKDCKRLAIQIMQRKI